MSPADRSSVRVEAQAEDQSADAFPEHRGAAAASPGRARAGAPWSALVPRSFRGRLAVIAVLAGALRAAYLVVERDTAVSADGWAYAAVARLVADGEGFRNPLLDAPTALHPPGWSAVLAIPSVLGIDWARTPQVVAMLLGVATVVLIGLLGRRVAGDRAGLLAAGLAAVHPELWLWERELASETLLLPLSVLVVLQAYRYQRAPGLRGAALLGGLCGLLVLTRTEQALLLAALVVPVVVADRTTSGRGRALAVGVAVACAAVTVSPWLAYNHGRFEEPVLLSTGAGVTLEYAYNPATYDGPLLGAGDPAVWGRDHPGDESEVDLHARELAFDHIRDRLGRLPVVVAAREGRTWGFFRPSQQVQLDQDWGHSPRWVYETGRWIYWATLPLAAVGAVVLRRRRVSLLPLAASAIVVVAYVAITYGQTRYRVTVHVSLVVLAAAAVDHLLARRAAGRVLDLRDGHVGPSLLATPEGRTGPRHPPRRPRPEDVPR